MDRCVREFCSRKAGRDGLCRSCEMREKNGDCVNGCKAPAASRKGWCRGCYQRGGEAPRRRNRPEIPSQRTCRKEGCGRKKAPHKRGLCSGCYLMERFGQCQNCTQPASGNSGVCSNCVKRGGGPNPSKGAVLNNAENRWCNRCSELKHAFEFYSSGERPARYCKKCSVNDAVRRARLRRERNLEWLSEWCEQTRGGLCVKCEEPTTALELDHVKPSSLGGADSVRNLQAMCRACNASKGNSESVDYRRWVEGFTPPW